MAMKYFFELYDALTQRRFEEALDDGELEKAATILNGLPSGRELYENVQKVKIMIEGYKAIISNINSINSLSFDERDELIRYREYGELEILEKIKYDYDKVKKVMEDMDIDDIEELEEDLKELERYRGFGDLEYLTMLGEAERKLENL